MKENVALVVVIPLGPGCKQEYIEDTINSVEFYVQSSYKIVLADDSQKNLGQLIKKKFPHVDVFVTPKSMGKLGGLYITLSNTFCYVLDKYDFKALLRMDTDALLIGNAPEKEALVLFSQNPQVGMAGQYPNDYEGRLWDRSWPGKQIYRMMHTLYFFKRPIGHLSLIRRYLKARKNNYERGESVFGGACFFSPTCLQALRSAGLLPLQALQQVRLEEDHVFSLLTKSIGFELAGLAGEGQAFGCAWLGLAAAPNKLLKDNKKIIHSTRFWQDMKEEEIRNWFKEHRKSLTSANQAYSINN